MTDQLQGDAPTAPAEEERRGRIEFNRRGHIAELVIDGTPTNKKKLNPMPPYMYPEMYDRLMEFEQDPDLRVLIMRGAGEDAFSVGGDLRAVGPTLQDKSDVLDRYWNPTREPLSPWVIRIGVYSLELSKPVIAAVCGYCLGAALTIVGQHADLVVCSEDAQFGLTELVRGLGGGTGARANLARHIPYRTAMRMVLTGESLAADEAVRVGLVNQAVPTSEVFPTAWRWAEQIAAMPPLVVRSEKQMLKRSLDLPYREVMPYADLIGVFNQMSQDATEGVGAFLEKREPVFRGM